MKLVALYTLQVARRGLDTAVRLTSADLKVGAICSAWAVEAAESVTIAYRKRSITCLIQVFLPIAKLFICLITNYVYAHCITKWVKACFVLKFSTLSVVTWWQLSLHSSSLLVSIKIIIISTNRSIINAKSCKLGWWMLII